MEGAIEWDEGNLGNSIYQDSHEHSTSVTIMTTPLSIILNGIWMSRSGFLVSDFL
jgi:hypothetical protein